MKFLISTMFLLFSGICFSQQLKPVQKNYKSFSLVKPTLKATNKEEKESLETSLRHVNSRWYKLMQKKNANYFLIQKEFDHYFKKHPLEGSAPREFGAGWLKTKLFYLNNKGLVQDAPTIDYNKIPKALQAGAPAVTDTTAGDWRMTGPRNSVFVTNVSSTGFGNYGGYANCVRIDPTNVNKLFISFIQGGLWTSANNGAAWRLSDANMPAEAYYDIDVCKANNNIVYAISASAVIKSIDGGFSWSVTALNKTNFAGTAYDLAVSPTDANIVVARWGANIYRTTNGGTNWTAVQTGLKDFSIWDCNSNSEVLDWDNSNTSIVYFTDRGDNQNYVDVYKSTNAGASFTLLQKLTLPAGATGAITGWSKICTATNNTTSLYVILGSGTDSYHHSAVQMYKLAVASGNVLLTRANMVPGIDQSYGSKTTLHHGDLAMDINNDNKIIYAGYSNQTAQYSSNNGVSFLSTAPDIHADIRGFYMINGKVILSTDGSAYISSNSGASFSVISNSISNHDLWGFGSAFKSDLLVAGCNHGPLMIRDYEAPGGWYHIIGADQQNSDINPLDSVTIYSNGYDSYHVLRTGIKSFTSGPEEVDPGAVSTYFNQMEFHPNLYKTLITHHGGYYPNGNANLATWKNSLIRSDDNGLTVKVVYTFTDRLFREKICMTNPNVIYAVVGLSNNTLLKSTTGGTSWTTITPPTTITTAGIRNISDIAVSDVNPDEIWVSYSGVQNTCQVLHSTNGGASYTNITTSVLTSNPITKMIFQRGTNGGVYVANTSGVYYRNNTLANWAKLGNGLPQADLRFMFINYNKGKLLIGTSRGGWDHNLYETSATKAQISASSNKVSCGGTILFKDYSVVRNASATWNWSFPGGTPASSTSENPSITYNNITAGAFYNVTLTVTDALGSNTQTLTNFIQAQNSCVTSTFNPNTFYRLINRQSAKSLDDLGYSTADNAPIGQWDYVSGTNQQWQLVDVGGGYYKIQNRLSGKVLDNPGFSTADNTGIVQYGYVGGENQKWAVTDIGGGYFSITNKYSGKALENPGFSTANGTQMVQYGYVGGSNQQWQIVDIGTARPANANQAIVSAEGAVSKQLKIYPNPVSDMLNIDLPVLVTRDAVIQILDINSQVVLSKKINNKTVQLVDVSKLPNGVYLLKVQDGKNIITSKFSKQ
jgi:Ricin-type beta-trefoil lectin domain-like/Secretion system C-terminal sorting domain/PKD domain